LSDALKASGDVDAKARQITELRKQLDDITGQLADRDEAARDAEKDLKKAEADLEKSEQRATSLESENEALRDAQGELAKQVDALKAELVNVTVKPVDDTKPLNDKPANNGLKARDRDEVEQAVADLPGFDNLSDAKQQNLVAMLEKGECVTTSLKAAYGHVPAVALRNLIRELGGRC
jgi:predicted nuclease with TOPRIM domain